MTLDELKSSLWGAAILLRGKINATGYKEYIFPLVFFKYTYGEEELTELLAKGPIAHEEEAPGAAARIKERLLPYGSRRRAAANTVRGLLRR